MFAGLISLNISFNFKISQIALDNTDMDPTLHEKVNLLVFLQSGKMEQALEKVEWLQTKDPSDRMVKELKR